MEGRGIRVETLPEDGHDVSPPLASLTLRTIEEIVPCIDIDGTQPFLPELVEERIVTGEHSVRSCIVTGLAVFNTRYFGTMLDRKDYLHAVEPAQGFIFLNSGLGNVFGPQTLLPDFGVVGLYQDPASSLVRLHGKYRSHLHVVG